MQPLTINCNHCAKLLEIESGIRFVTCKSCKTLMEVVKTNSSIYTKILSPESTSSQPPQNVQSTNKDSSEIYRQIEMLEQEWSNEQATYVEKGSLPHIDGNLNMFGGYFGIVFGIVWTLVAGSFNPIMGIFGILIVFLSIWDFMNYSNRKDRYLAARKKYIERKNALIAKL